MENIKPFTKEWWIAVHDKAQFRADNYSWMITICRKVEEYCLNRYLNYKKR